MKESFRPASKEDVLVIHALSIERYGGTADIRDESLLE